MVRLLAQVMLVVIVTVGMGVGGLAAAKRVRTGTWSIPVKEDYVWIERAVKPKATPRTVYLDRNRVTVTGGRDSAAVNQSQLITWGTQRTLPGFTGSKRSWNRIVSCVKSKFTDFDVEITDQRPANAGYVSVHVGGEPRDLFGRDRRNMGGVAPYNGKVIHDGMGFVFSKTLRNRQTEICESIAHEIGHIYGLDHSYRCGDLMTYIQGCKKRRFVDADVRCGEGGRRDCENGEATQNSHDHLLGVLGPAKLPEDDAAQPKKSTRVASR